MNPPSINNFFETTKDVGRILQNLMLASGQKISPGTTLIVFDEVQDCPNVINSMKYFCENAPQYHIACAGSLLGIALAKPSSFPVGKVDFMQVEPMTFTEFLMANNDVNLARYIQEIDTLSPIPDAFFNPLCEKLKSYYVTGGMPEPVLMWTQERDVEAMQTALSNIISAYEKRFCQTSGCQGISPYFHDMEVYPFISCPEKIKSFCIKLSRKVPGPVNMKTLFSGW
mgnify:CR=1 FL=1